MKDSATLVGDDLRVEGLLEGDGDLVVAGHVQGIIRVTGTLTVTRSGVVLADVNAHDVVVEGNLEGSVRVAGSVRIGPHGSVLGDVRGRLHIADGGSHQGAVRTPRPSAKTDYAARPPQLRDTVPSAERPPQSSPGAAPKSVAR